MTASVFQPQSPYSNHKVCIPTTNCTGLPRVTWRDYPRKNRRAPRPNLISQGNYFACAQGNYFALKIEFEWETDAKSPAFIARETLNCLSPCTLAPLC